MSSSSPSPLSDESNGQKDVLRDFVHETNARDLQPMTLSPRSAVLAHSSLKTPPLSDGSANMLNGDMHNLGQIRKRGSGKRRQRGRDAARPTVLSQLLDVDFMKKDPRDEVERLRELLITVKTNMRYEANRADELQKANQEAQKRLRNVIENKLDAEKEAAKANQEIRLFQLQLENAKMEIERNQKEMRQVEKERDEAEATAARAREKARQFHEQQQMLAAREEGRRLGYQAGVEHARAERRTSAARAANSNPIRRPLEDMPRSRVDKGKGKEISDNHYSNYAGQSSSRRRQQHSSLNLELSPSQLPLRNLPLESEQPLPAPTARVSQSSTLLHNFRPIPDSGSEPEVITPHLSAPQPPPPVHPQPQQFAEPVPSDPYFRRSAPQPPPPEPTQLQQFAEPVPNDRSQTPATEIWEVDVPPGTKFVWKCPPDGPEFNTEDDPHAIIASMPRENWVTDPNKKPPRSPPNFPGKYPPPLPRPSLTVPLIDVPPRKQGPPPPKAVKLPKITRPSLPKQVSSWYRSLSQRKRNKPVIDPVPEEPQTASSTAPPNSASTTNDHFDRPIVNGQTIESIDIYGSAPQPSPSWYQPKQTAAASVRSHFYAASSRASGASTKMSQFDLLATPRHGTESESGRGGRKLKEKENNLSTITENPSSRGNTPDRSNLNAIPRVNGIFLSPFLHPSFAQSSRENIGVAGPSHNRRSRPRPPSIDVPEPDAILDPPGLAYKRNSHGTNGSSLKHKSSLNSLGTAPNTSYGIEVIPPSGLPMLHVQSPPHTGVNHLSPYHTFRPPQPHSSSLFVANQSVTSLRTDGSNRKSSPLHSRTPRTVEPRRKSKLSVVNGYPNSAENHEESTRISQPMPQTPQRPSGQHGHVKHNSTPYRPSEPLDRPKSVRSATSERPASIQAQSIASSSNLVPNGITTLRHENSYSKFNFNGYVDPAFWPPEGPDGLVDVAPRNGRNSINGNLTPTPSRPISRAGSPYSSLISYENTQKNTYDLRN